MAKLYKPVEIAVAYIAECDVVRTSGLLEGRTEFSGEDIYGDTWN